MESQPQNPEFRINPENFHPCIICLLNQHFMSLLLCKQIHYTNYVCFIDYFRRHKKLSVYDILSICVTASIDDQKICRKVPYPKSNCVFVVNLKDVNEKDLSCDDSGPYNKYSPPTVVVETMFDNNKLAS